jgi:chromate reductase, NAD(P)H dehydrogenase (quinone)
MAAESIRLVGIAGSLRKGSYNRKLLAAAQRLVPTDATLEIVPIDVIPLYNGDEEANSGIPRPVAALKEAITEADGVVIATPEYNGGIPGVMKNVIDWVSRPSADIPRVLHGKPVVLMGATPGGLGTVLSQTAWLPVLRHLRMRLWTGGGSLYVSSAAKVFDEEGLADPEVEERLRAFIGSFVESLRPRA